MKQKQKILNRRDGKHLEPGFRFTGKKVSEQPFIRESLRKMKKTIPVLTEHVRAFPSLLNRVRTNEKREQV